MALGTLAPVAAAEAEALLVGEGGAVGLRLCAALLLRALLGEKMAVAWALPLELGEPEGVAVENDERSGEGDTLGEGDAEAGAVGAEDALGEVEVRSEAKDVAVASNGVGVGGAEMPPEAVGGALCETEAEGGGVGEAGALPLPPCKVAEAVPLCTPVPVAIVADPIGVKEAASAVGEGKPAEKEARKLLEAPPLLTEAAPVTEPK